MHGNEPAGAIAIELILKMLDVEIITNPEFTLDGRVVGIIGNTRAYATQTRYIDVDLNRIWHSDQINLLLEEPQLATNSEESEMMDIIDLINQIEVEHPSPHVIVMDIHTTSSASGIFTIPSHSDTSLSIAQNLHAPVIHGMLEGVSGTLLHYFTEEYRETPTDTVVFEAGQHDEPLSINRAIAAITNCFRTLGMVKSEHIENVHDRLLLEHCRGLPLELNLIYKHSIQSEDRYVMKPGFKNFDSIREGDLLGHSRHGAVLSPYSGRLLMPLYQVQGDEAFFIIQDIRTGGETR